MGKRAVAGVSDRADGHAASFDDYFRRSKKPLVAMAYVLTGDQQSAQDLTQEALLRTWNRWSRVSKYDNPEAWTRRVLFNLIVSRTRANRIRRRVVDAPRSVSPPDELHVALAAVLRSLPKEQMKALVLHDGAGVPIREVAAEMKVPEGTVKSWLSRGRAAAALSLEEYPPSRAKERHA